MDEFALEFSHVSKAYQTDGGDGRYALKDVSFQIPASEVVAIVGRSGSGKSTLLHLAAGIDIPSQGEVVLNGHRMNRLSDRARTLLRRDFVGLVFQFFYLLPHLSVRENVILPELIAGGDPHDFEARAAELLQRVGLADRSRDNVQKLSGGEMQRVAICRALLRKPRLLLADEPSGNLDDDTGRMVMNLMLEMAAEEGTTLIYVTHSRELAGLSQRLWRLHSGLLETP